MTDLTWDEFQEDKKKAEQQVSLILKEFGEKYDLEDFDVFDLRIEERWDGTLYFKLEVKI